MTAARPGRIAFLDGLRGIASLTVAIYHVVRPAVVPVSATGYSILSTGFLGVPLFFIISGFAIAQSLEGGAITAASTGRFLLRRVCRLDPPYWASMLVCFVVAAAAARALHADQDVRFGWKVVLANVFYVQYILGIVSISDVYWTLTFEIQFYLLLALLLGVSQRLEPRLGSQNAFALVFGPLLAYSLLVMRALVPTFTGACFAYWPFFFTGVVAQRLVARGETRTFVVALLLIIVGVNENPYRIVILAVAGLIAYGHSRGKLGVWLSSRPWQYLGRISYSLYLTHWAVGGRFANLVNKLLNPSPMGRIFTSFLGLAAAIAFAHAFWWAIERPSLRLSRMVAMRRSTPPAPAIAAA